MKKSEKPDISLISAPDKTTSDYICRILGSEGVSWGDSVTGAKHRPSDSLPVEKTDLPILLLVPCAKQGSNQISLAKRFVACKGVVFVWSSAHRTAKTSDDEERLLENLLAQTGALTSSRLHEIVLAVKTLTHLCAKPPFAIRIKGQSNQLASRMAGIAEDFNASVRKKESCSVTASANSEGVTIWNGNRKLIVRDISALAHSLSLLSTLNPADAISDKPEFETNLEEAFSIAQPPARLLSETTSKRLISCFGLGLPNERLCKSAAQAVHFASSFRGPAVIKLVKPALENKMSLGAVRTGISGQAAVRRAVGSLESLNRSLGPPAALGFLVSEQVEAGNRIWLKISDHPKYGRLVLLGAADFQSVSQAFALAVPATAEQAAAALKSAIPDLAGDSVRKLAKAVSGFSRMAHKLKDRIDRAEISPLAEMKTHEKAIVLDALVAVGAGR